MNASDPQTDRELLLDIHHDVKQLKTDVEQLKEVKTDIKVWKKITQAVLWMIGVTGAALGIFIDWKDIVK